MLEKVWNSTEVIQADQFSQFSISIMSEIWPEGAKKWPNRLKIEDWPHKLADMTYIGLKGLNLSLILQKASVHNMLDFLCKISKQLAKLASQVAKRGQNRPRYHTKKKC